MTRNLKWKQAQWQEGEADGLRSYVCKSCGGEIVGDENTAATSCPFCGNPVVMMGQFSGALKPDLVIPFKLDKKAAKEGLKKHLTGKRFLPKIFKDQNHIDEIKGIYVPFWLFDTDVDAQPISAHGVTATITIPRPAILWCTEVAASALNTCRWTAHPRWRTI